MSLALNVMGRGSLGQLGRADALADGHYGFAARLLEKLATLPRVNVRLRKSQHTTAMTATEVAGIASAAVVTNRPGDIGVDGGLARIERLRRGKTPIG